MTPLGLEDRRELLGALPLFTSFTERELSAAAEAFVEVMIPAGATVVGEGETDGDFMVVASGELEVWAGEPPAVVARVGPGEPMGEVAALMGEGRTATVTAARRSRVLRMPRATFMRIIASNPVALDHLTQVLARRLTGRMREEATVVRAGVIAVMAEPGIGGGSLVATSLGSLLGSMTGRDAVVVRIEPGRSSPLASLSDAPPAEIIGSVQPGGGGAGYLAVSVDRGDRVMEPLERVSAALAERYGAVVLDVCGHADLAPESMAEISDAIVEVVGQPEGTLGRYGSHTRVFRVLDLWNAQTPAVPLNAIQPIVLPADPAMIGRSRDEIVKHILTEPRSRLGRPLHRLARAILGCSVGVALGGGAALGISHVGVLRALEAADIPIDLVVGSSFGSIVSLGYAAGLPPEEMTEIARRIGTVRTTLSALDVAVMKPGLLSGNRLVSIFGPLAGPVRRFEHLAVPAVCVAADVRTGDRVLLGEGELSEALRASCSIPMVFVPAERDGRALVDGAMIDPVPVAVASERGADITIGVNVVPRVGEGDASVLSKGLDLLQRVNPVAHLNGTAGSPNVFDVIMNSIHLLQRELSVYKTHAADVSIDVDAGGITWHQFHRAMELIERGERAGTASIPAIRRVLATRLGPVATRSARG